MFKALSNLVPFRQPPVPPEMDSLAPRFDLPSTITTGRVNNPTTPTAHKLAEELLEKDREIHHCFFNKRGFHNHLSHHILAAFDFGAPAKLLQAIYDEEDKHLKPIDTDFGIDQELDNTVITDNNWVENLGKPSLYASYLKFFTEQIIKTSSVQVLNRFLFSAEASTDEADMIHRFLSGALHPIIQTGYGAEFGSDAMIAQGLAQTAIHKVSLSKAQVGPLKPTTPNGTPLLEIAQSFYDLDVLKPPMPYKPDVTNAERLDASLKDGRSEKIRELSALWFPSGPVSHDTIEKKLEELYWFVTLIYAGTGKKGYKPRLDFFIMHILNTTSFVPSLLKYIPSLDDQQRLLSSLLPVVLTFVVSRGRPRIDCELFMSYTAAPKYKPDTEDAHDALGPAELDPWVDIVREVVHAKDAHTVKATRSLYLGARHYASRLPGEVPGAGKLKGSEFLDGTAFVRAARVTLDNMGWVTNGDDEGKWDFLASGYDDAWENEKPINA